MNGEYWGYDFDDEIKGADMNWVRRTIRGKNTLIVARSIIMQMYCDTIMGQLWIMTYNRICILQILEVQRLDVHIILTLTSMYTKYHSRLN